MTFTQKDPRAKTHKGEGSESAILLGNMWVILYSISHKIFLMCIDKADHCAAVKSRAQWHREIMKWPHRLWLHSRDSCHGGLKHYQPHPSALPPCQRWHPPQHREQKRCPCTSAAPVGNPASFTTKMKVDGAKIPTCTREGLKHSLFLSDGSVMRAVSFSRRAERTAGTIVAYKAFVRCVFTLL